MSLSKDTINRFVYVYVCVSEYVCVSICSISLCFMYDMCKCAFLLTPSAFSWTPAKTKPEDMLRKQKETEH